MKKPALKQTLECDNNMVEGGYFLQPGIDGLGGLYPQVIPLRLYIQGLNGDICLYNPAIMRPIESMVGLPVLRLKAIDRSVYFEFDDRDGGSWYEGYFR